MFDWSSLYRVFLVIKFECNSSTILELKPTLIEYKITKIQYNLDGRTNLQYKVAIVQKVLCLFLFLSKVEFEFHQKTRAFQSV